MMDQRSARLVERPPSARAEAKAKIDVVKGDRKVLLVKATDRQKLGALDHEACRGHRTDELRQMGAPKIAVVTRGLKTMRVTGPPSDAENDAGMLDRAVRVAQARAHRPHIGPDRLNRQGL